jgi:GDP-4-dehydro-6-deoxy-D-mannose reductase
VAPVSPYALGKACGELSSLYYGGMGGVDIIIVRAFNHTGPGQTDVFALPSFARQIAEAEKGAAEPQLRVGNLDVIRDFTDVRDVVRAYQLLLEKEPPGALYNVCSGRGRRLGDLVDMLASMSKVPVEIVVEEHRKRAAEIPALVGDNSLLSRDMGWRPEIPIEKTLQDLLEYWRGRVGEGGVA